jgi:hypothetical protein
MLLHTVIGIARTRGAISLAKICHKWTRFGDSGNRRREDSPSLVQEKDAQKNYVKDRLQRPSDVLLSGPFKKVSQPLKGRLTKPQDTVFWRRIIGTQQSVNHAGTQGPGFCAVRRPLPENTI